MEKTDITVGWIGTGVMGGPMWGHLMAKKGYRTLVYNRTKSKADKLIEAGAEFKEIDQIAKEADFLFIMLGYPKDVEEVTIGKDGILQYMKEGAVLL